MVGVTAGLEVYAMKHDTKTGAFQNTPHSNFGCSAASGAHSFSVLGASREPREHRNREQDDRDRVPFKYSNRTALYSKNSSQGCSS
jgi:hypothetical protein